LIDENSNDVDARVGRGILYGRIQNYTQAIEDLAFVTNKTPEYTDAWMALGNIYRWIEQPEKAIDAYTKGIELQPENSDTYINRARAFQQYGDSDSALHDLETAKTLNGNLEEIEPLIDRIKQPQTSKDLLWELSYRYDLLTFSPRTTEWNTHNTSIKRKLPHGSIALDMVHTDRFSMSDRAFGIDVYHDLWKDSYGNFRLQYSDDADLLPKWDAYGEIFQSFAETWEVSGSANIRDYRLNDVNIYGFGLGKYIDNWYLRAKTYVTDQTGQDLEVSQAFAIRYFFADEDYLEFSSGFGTEAVELGPGPIIDTRDTHFFAINGQKFLNRHVALQAGLFYQDIDDSPIRRGFSVGAIFRW
jgi:YaiO family outer membrane protein